MNHLARQLAPIGPQAWDQVDEEARRTLRHLLAGRRLVEVTGPLGWEASAVPRGRLGAPDPVPASKVELRPRQVHRFVETRRLFAVARSELDAAERGATDVDLGAVVDAARDAALAEDWCVFHGQLASGLEGIATVSPHEPVRAGDDYERYPHAVARAVAVLEDAGVGGPYGLALGAATHRGVVETAERGGYPLVEHLKLVLGGAVLRAPAVDGAVVVSQRGGDFELLLGEDFSIGYAGHDHDEVRFFLESSFAFRIAGPEAGIALLASPERAG